MKITKNIKLSKKDFLEQITRYGFFAEQFPECFSSEDLADNVYELLKYANNSKATLPTTLSTYKNDISRRILSVSNPESFLRLSKFISDNWERIKTYSASSNSISPIISMTSYEEYLTEYLNCESVKEHFKLKSDFISGIQKCIRISLGYKYRMKIDISNCYNSLYTHSITWAICGKQAAKEYMFSKTPVSLKDTYSFADRIDKLVRFQKNNETNGIIVGPYTSRIVSEIVLAAIDKELSDSGFIFKRYVDDYKMYFRNESDAISSLPKIEKILNEYNLSLNTSKTKIEKYPYDNLSDLKAKFTSAMSNGGVFSVLNEASILHLSGEKGAYKYALKYIKDKHLTSFKERQIIIPTLINIMFVDPRYGKFVTRIFKENLPYIQNAALSQVLNQELKSDINSGLQQEVLLIVQMINDLGLTISGKNLLNILKSENDFAIIIALDIWKNNKKCVIRTKSEAKSINKEIKVLINKLQKEDIKGSRWLLIYELQASQLVKASLYPKTEFDDFFKKMLSLNIRFYKPVNNSRKKA